MMMMMMKVSVSLMTFLWILTVSRGDPEVSCVFNETCILPCSFEVGPHVNIHWFQLEGGIVHSYYYDKEVLKYQPQRFRNRTSLFKDQISRGNASLQLTGVKVQDEGRYKCRICTFDNINDSFINLKVDAPVHDVNIQQVENRITCSSEGIYPEPELTWSTRPPSTMSLQNTSTVQQNEQQLYSISSSLVLSDNDTDLVYSCTVKTRRNNRTATLTTTRSSVSAGGIKLMMDKTTWVLFATAAAAVVVGAVVGLQMFCKKKRGLQEKDSCREIISEGIKDNALNVKT